MTLDVAVDDLRRAGKAAGGSLNDAYLSAVAAALGLYHERMGVPVDGIPFALPVSLRTENDPGASNRWAPARILAPTGQVGARARTEDIHRLMVDARQQAALDAVGRISPLMTFMPRWVLSVLAARATGIDVQVSNVPGWSGGELFLAGARVLSAYPFGPLPGCAAMVTLLSVKGNCHIGVNYDPAAITAPDLFATCLDDGFDEMRRLAEPSGRRPRSAASKNGAVAKNGAAGRRRSLP
jgi:hypothetical protein